MGNKLIGLGNGGAEIRVYIGNRPPLPEYQQLNSMRPLLPGEVSVIAEQTGNHWRKIFTIYAKLMFALNPQGEASWQQYRDNRLLQAGADHALLFGAPDVAEREAIHLVSGRRYAVELGIDLGEEDFTQVAERRLIVGPYFDYRQLSNKKLARLVELINGIRT